MFAEFVMVTLLMYSTVDFPLPDARSRLAYWQFERVIVSSGEFRDKANICEIEIVQNTFHTHSLCLHPIAFDVVNLYIRSKVVTLRSTRFYVKEFGRMCGRSLMVTGIRTGYLLIMLQLCQPLDTR